MPQFVAPRVISGMPAVPVRELESGGHVSGAGARGSTTMPATWCLSPRSLVNA